MSQVKGLYAIIDTGVLDDTQLNSTSEKLLSAGCKWLQYRDKSTDSAKRLEQASALSRLCTTYRANLIINDDYKLAQMVGAAGVHLGQKDGSVEPARQALGANAIIGRTCHDSLKLATNAKNEGADYIAFGRFFPSKTKPKAKPADLNILQKAQALGLPIVAIGGITRDTAPTLIRQGAHCIAICNDLLCAENIEEQTQHYLRLFV